MRLSSFPKSSVTKALAPSFFSTRNSVLLSLILVVSFFPPRPATAFHHYHIGEPINLLINVSFKSSKSQQSTILDGLRSQMPLFGMDSSITMNPFSLLPFQNKSNTGKEKKEILNLSMTMMFGAKAISTPLITVYENQRDEKDQSLSKSLQPSKILDSLTIKFAYSTSGHGSESDIHAIGHVAHYRNIVKEERQLNTPEKEEEGEKKGDENLDSNTTIQINYEWIQEDKELDSLGGTKIMALVIVIALFSTLTRLCSIDDDDNGNQAKHSHDQYARARQHHIRDYRSTKQI